MVGETLHFSPLLSNHTLRVKVDGVCSSSIDVISCVPKGSILGPLFVFVVHCRPSKATSECAGWLC